MKMKILSFILALGLAVFVASAEAHGPEEHAAYGEPGNAKSVNRTITVVMSDEMRFDPNNITVKRGQTIRFVVKNGGTIRHEMMIGTIEELQEHAKLMQQFPEMEHDDPNAVSVDPGKTAEMVWKFTNPGNFDFACLVPGHYESGMKGRIIVSR